MECYHQQTCPDEAKKAVTLEIFSPYLFRGYLKIVRGRDYSYFGPYKTNMQGARTNITSISINVTDRR